MERQQIFKKMAIVCAVFALISAFGCASTQVAPPPAEAGTQGFPDARLPPPYRRGSGPKTS